MEENPDREPRKAIQNAIRALNQALTLIDIASEAIDQQPGRIEVSFAKANCQQARHWMIDTHTALTLEDKETIELTKDE